MDHTLDTLRREMISTWTRTPVLLAALVLASACAASSQASSGSSPTPTPTPTASRAQHIASVDACTLVTTDEATAAVGTPVSNLSSSGGVQVPGLCLYGAPGSSSSVFVYAQVYPDTSTADAVQPDAMAAILAGQLGVTNAHSVSGIGDKAFEYTASGSGGNGIAIFVFKYNAVMMIAVDPASDPSKVEQLARTAVGRLAST